MAKVIVIFSTKGGVGKTLIGANLAVSLASDRPGRVCLIDLDLQAPGDMARILNIRPQKTLIDLINTKEITPETFKKESFMSIRSDLGIHFLQGVLKPPQSASLSDIKVKNVLDSLSKDKGYDFIIVDAGKVFSDILISSLTQANLIMLMVTPDVLSVYQTKWILDTLQSLHFPLRMIKIVLNRADSTSSISWQEVKASLLVDIIARIPSEGRVAGIAVNSATPFVIESPRTKISLAIKKLSEELINNHALYTDKTEIDEIKIKSAALEGEGDFWKKQDLVGFAQEETEVIDASDEILALKRKIHNRLISELNIKRLDLKVFSDVKKKRELKEKAEAMVTNFLAEEVGGFISSHEVRKKLVKEIIDEALGLGPLEDLLADPAITDIMVNNKDEIYIERNGKIEFTSKKFISNEQVKIVIERIIGPLGRRIDESVPMVDARLPDGSRVNAIIPPLSLTGPSLAIRKFRKERFEVKELIELNTLNQPTADFIHALVLARKNIIVSGGTGSGKTTILNVLSEFIPNDERIITLEDAAELRLHKDHWVRLESRPPNIEGKGEITIRELFRNTLRMRPDRIVIGECRGLETLDMLQAMNTGHDGSMTTVHANSTRDVLVRLDSMILMSGVELPIRAIREMVASAVDIIIHTARLSDGSRKIIQVTEVAGMLDEVHIDLKDIFAFNQTGIDEKGNVLGYFTATGYVPSFFDEMKIKGIAITTDIFKPSSPSL